MQTKVLFLRETEDHSLTKEMVQLRTSRYQILLHLSFAPGIEELPHYSKYEQFVVFHGIEKACTESFRTCSS